MNYLITMFLLSDDYWRVQKTKGKGNGIFAKKPIKAGTVIGDYLGIVIKSADYDIGSDAKGLYLLCLTDDASIYPDVTKPGLHLVNHSCDPNCWMYLYEGHTLFFAIKDIKKQEELTISYLLSPLDETCKPCTHHCRCKSKFCTGTMHLSKTKYVRWQKFQDMEKKNMKPAKFIYGKNLKKLSYYPTTIPLHPIYAYMCSNT